MTGIVWRPGDDFLARSNVARLMRAHGISSYKELRAIWREDVGAFWLAVADDLGVHWYDRPALALDRSRGNEWPRWFPGGMTNLVASCVDRHDAHRLALTWEGEEGTIRRLNFGDLSTLAGRIAGGLRAAGIGPGDRVGLYLPLVPEAIGALYACAKIGALAVPMFSGFGTNSLAVRLADAEAKVVLTADGYYRRGKTIDMSRVAEAAASLVPSVERIVVFPRLGSGDWAAFLDCEPVVDPLPVSADHPFLLAYTSGTTGKPKGAVHTHGGFPLKAASEASYHLDQRDGEPLLWLTDLGWIMAPLTALGAGLAGRPLLLYDGAPDHPRPARVAELIERHEVAVFGTSPTYVRALMSRDDHGFERGLPSLRVLASTGEPWSDVSWHWYFEHVGGGRCPIVNIGGGTEAGSLLAVLPILPLKPSSFNSSAVGVDADVVGADGRSVPPGELGELVIRQPWPGQTAGLWRDDERYLSTYWTRWPGVWAHGDWASRDRDGFWFLHGRSDDTMMIAGKRVGPSEVESVLVTHDSVRDCAAVGLPDPVKGESIWCFVVLREGSDDITEALRGLVAERLGQAFRPAAVVAVSALPKTRSGKIMRRAIRDTVVGRPPGDLGSLENPEALEELRLATAPTR